MKSSPTKCEFARHLDAQPFPAKPAPDLKPRMDTRGRKAVTRYGQWLHEHNYPVFLREYAKFCKLNNLAR